MVCAARTDLEADIALELVKEHDPRGERTVGVLTKVCPVMGFLNLYSTTTNHTQ